MVAAPNLGLPENRVNLMITYTGGSFGGRLGSGLSPGNKIPTPTAIGFPSYGTLTAKTSIELGLPVKLEFTRQEDFLYHWSRGGFDERVRIGFKKDGTLTTMDIAAEKLGMDPIDLRKKNHIRSGVNFLSFAYDFNEEGHYLCGADFSKCLDRGDEKIG